jgi:hypothetical protein
LHVLSMPPAFVLSQDQTLMFNPGDPRHLPGSRRKPDRATVLTKPNPSEDEPGPIDKGRHNAYLGAQARAYTPAQAATTQRRRPRIPSHTNNVNQQSAPERRIRARRYQRLTPRSRRARIAVTCNRPQRGINLVSVRRSVQSLMNKNSSAWEIRRDSAGPSVTGVRSRRYNRPSARNSVSMCGGIGASGSASQPRGMSAGASDGVR